MDFEITQLIEGLANLIGELTFLIPAPTFKTIQGSVISNPTDSQMATKGTFSENVWEAPQMPPATNVIQAPARPKGLVSESDSLELIWV